MAVGVVGLVATATPPVRGATIGITAFVAAVAVPGGIGDPILTLPTSANVLLGTPFTTAEHLVGGFGGPPTCLPLPTPPDGFTNCHWTFDHPRMIAVVSIACEDVLANVLKAKPVAHPPGCAFVTVAGALPNTISGHCGLSAGQFLLFYVDGLGNPYLLDLHFSTVGLTVLSGHWLNALGQAGLVIGVGELVPPTPVANPGQRCLDKSAVDFLLPGVLALLPV